MKAFNVLTPGLASVCEEAEGSDRACRVHGGRPAKDGQVLGPPEVQRMVFAR